MHTGDFWEKDESLSPFCFARKMGRVGIFVISILRFIFWECGGGSISFSFPKTVHPAIHRRVKNFFIYLPDLLPLVSLPAGATASGENN
jgi:hypothetical protein